MGRKESNQTNKQFTTWMSTTPSIFEIWINLAGLYWDVILEKKLWNSDILICTWMMWNVTLFILIYFI